MQKDLEIVQNSIYVQIAVKIFKITLFEIFQALLIFIVSQICCKAL